MKAKMCSSREVPNVALKMQLRRVFLFCFHTGTIKTHVNDPLEREIEAAEEKRNCGNEVLE
jgi:hypothetical protein